MLYKYKYMCLYECVYCANEIYFAAQVHLEVATKITGRDVNA